MIYLDNTATTFPKPKCVTDEMSKCIKQYCGNPGRSSHKLSQKSAEKIYEARSIIADMFGGEAENVVFTYNTTYALNIAIKSHIKEGCHILISDIEHNSVIRPVCECARRKMCTYSVFSSSPDPDTVIANIKKCLTINTTMLICTHVSNVGARIMPIAEIGKFCRENGIYFIVDAAQSAGTQHINVNDFCIDALCMPGHKGLYGPQGVGIILFGSDSPSLSVIEGGTGINSLETVMPDFLPERYEAGTLSTPAIAGLCESLKWLKFTDIDKIRHHEENLYLLLCDLLSTNKNITVYRMDKNPGNTLMFNVNGKSSASVAYYLDKKDICVRSGFHCSPFAHRILKTGDGGAVRVGIGVYNTQKDIYSLCEALEQI